MEEKLKQEFSIIDAEAEVRKRMTAQIEILRIALRLARYEWVGLKDKFRVKEIIRKYPEFEYYIRGD